MSEPRRAMVRNASDVEQVSRAKLSQKVQRDNELNEMREVLSSRAGRNVLWRILSQCGLFESLTVQSSEIYVRSGRRDAGLALIAEIGLADQMAYIRMQTEQAKDEELKVEPEPTKESDV